MNIFIHNNDQSKLIQKIIDEFFTTEYELTINDGQQLLKIQEKTQKKVFDFIEIKYYSTGLIQEVRANRGIGKTRVIYKFDRHGSFEGVRYEHKKGVSWRPGRIEDGLYYRSYDFGGKIINEGFVDFETGVRHNLKGYAAMSIKPDGSQVRAYYVMGEFVGENIPDGTDLETYLANYRIMK